MRQVKIVLLTLFFIFPYSSFAGIPSGAYINSFTLNGDTEPCKGIVYIWTGVYNNLGGIQRDFQGKCTFSPTKVTINTAINGSKSADYTVSLESIVFEVSNIVASKSTVGEYGDYVSAVWHFSIYDPQKIKPVTNFSISRLGSLSKKRLFIALKQLSDSKKAK